MKKLNSLPLAAKIFLGLALGIVAGVCFLPAPQLAVDYIKPFGTIFLNLIQFIVVPIVFFSIICGVISMKDIKKVGSVGVKPSSIMPAPRPLPSPSAWRSPTPSGACSRC